MLLSGCVNRVDKVKIQISSWGSKTEVAIMKDVLAEFERQNPDIKVEFLHIPQNYFQKIHLLFASNTEPDVVFLNNQYLPIYANAGKLEPLLLNVNGFDSKALEALSWHDDLFALPRDISLLVVYYNKDLFARAGVDVPQKGWTLQDFLEKAIAIKQKTGVYGVSFEEDPLFYLPYLMSEGGGFYDIDSVQSQRALKFYADLRLRHHVAPRREESASATMAQMFLQEKIAMHVSGRWLTPKYREDAEFEWDVVGFPAGSMGAVVPLDASGWAISKASAHKAESIRLIEFLASREVIERFAQTGLIVPARVDVHYSDSDVYAETLKTAKPTPVDVNYNRLLDELKLKNEKGFMPQRDKTH